MPAFQTAISAFLRKVWAKNDRSDETAMAKCEDS
jgi:hypothetical protein